MHYVGKVTWRRSVLAGPPLTNAFKKYPLVSYPYDTISKRSHIMCVIGGSVCAVFGSQKYFMPS